MITIHVDDRFNTSKKEQPMHFEDAEALCTFLRENPVTEDDGGKRYILTMLDLSGQNLRGVNLENMLVFQCNLQGADLHGANLRNAGLIETDFSGADMTGVELRQASLTAAKFNNTKMAGCNMAATIARDAEFRGADLSGSTIGSTGFSNSDLDGANFSDVEFSNGVDFEHASVQNANFTGARAKAAIRAMGANFSGTIIPRAVAAQIQGAMASSPMIGAANLRRYGRGQRINKLHIGGLRFGS